MPTFEAIPDSLAAKTSLRRRPMTATLLDRLHGLEDRVRTEDVLRSRQRGDAVEVDFQHRSGAGAAPPGRARRTIAASRQAPRDGRDQSMRTSSRPSASSPFRPAALLTLLRVGDVSEHRRHAAADRICDAVPIIAITISPRSGRRRRRGRRSERPGPSCAPPPGASASPSRCGPRLPSSCHVHRVAAPLPRFWRAVLRSSPPTNGIVALTSSRATTIFVGKPTANTFN